MPSGSLIEVLLESHADAGARTMEQHALVLGADAERLADLGGAAARDVAKGDDDLLALGQLIDRALHELDRLRRDEPLLGQRPPVRRVRAPVTRVRVFRPAEALGLDRRLGLVRVVVERRERDAPRLANGARAGDVGDDREYPR